MFPSLKRSTSVTRALLRSDQIEKQAIVYANTLFKNLQQSIVQYTATRPSISCPQILVDAEYPLEHLDTPQQ